MDKFWLNGIFEDNYAWYNVSVDGKNDEIIVFSINLNANFHQISSKFSDLAWNFVKFDHVRI